MYFAGLALWQRDPGLHVWHDPGDNSRKWGCSQTLKWDKFSHLFQLIGVGNINVLGLWHLEEHSLFKYISELIVSQRTREIFLIVWYYPAGWGQCEERKEIFGDVW